MKNLNNIMGLLCLFPSLLYSQISTREKPVSFQFAKTIHFNPECIVLDTLDMLQIMQEDSEDESNGMPPRFGYPHPVDINLTNAGTWYNLPDGSKIWILKIVCPNATSINILYDQFYLPERAKLFIYNAKHSHVIGAFTSNNNKGTIDSIKGFATGLIYGDTTIIEYYLPSDVIENGIISMKYIVHGYRFISFNNDNYGNSGHCQVNVNCSEGDNWQREKDAVALILVDGIRWCTGSLVNTTSRDFSPLLLSAYHCFHGSKDANSPPVGHSFYWAYESPDCNTLAEPLILSTVGCAIIAENSTSDFALLRLEEDPRNLADFTPFYLGWDRSDTAIAGGVCIHHPRTDIKKISTYTETPISAVCSNSNYWGIGFVQTENGYSVVEPGSSGSSLINAERRVIGQLWRGYNQPECTWPSDNLCDSPDLLTAIYGKFSVSWTGNNSSSPGRKLQPWLDPLNTGEVYIDGLSSGCSSSAHLPHLGGRTIKGNIIWDSPRACKGQVIIDSNAVLTISDTVKFYESATLIVRPGGKLIVNGGVLTNACPDQLWQGIRVEGNTYEQQLPQHQGTVVLKNEAVIANARFGIATSAADRDASNFYDTFGGIIKASNSTFKNNMQAVVFESYTRYGTSGNIIDNESHFSNCHFLLDSNNILASNPNADFRGHITMHGVRGIKILGCNFENLTGNHNGRAIYAEDAGFTVKYYCPSINTYNTPSLCEPCIDGISSSFYGFHTAIEANTTGQQHALSVDKALFFDNQTSIAIAGNNSAQVIRSEFNQYQPYAGIRLSAASGYHIEKNSFQNYLHCLPPYNLCNAVEGIRISNSGIADNLITRNHFDGYDRAISVGGINSNSPAKQSTGLEFRCNNFENNHTDIFVTSSASIKSVQGSMSQGADNLFIKTDVSSFINGAYPVAYYYSSGKGHAPYLPSSTVTPITINVIANPCASTLCPQLPAPYELDYYLNLQSHQNALLTTYQVNGYDDIMSQYHQGFLIEESQLQPALTVWTEMMRAGDQMRALSHHSLHELLSATEANNDLLKQWYENIHTPSAKYSLAETQFQTGEYAAAQNTLAQIPTQFNFNDNELAEHENYMRFHNIKNNMANGNKNWYSLTESELAELENIAVSTKGRSATMAQGVLCFFYNNCMENNYDLKIMNDEDLSQTTSLPIKTSYMLINDNYSLITLFPNPATHEIEITSGGETISHIEIFDLQGRRILTGNINSANGKINIYNLENGIYFAKIHVCDNKIITRKIVKQ